MIAFVEMIFPYLRRTVLVPPFNIECKYNTAKYKTSALSRMTVQAINIRLQSKYGTLIKVLLATLHYQQPIRINYHLNPCLQLNIHMQQK